MPEGDSVYQLATRLQFMRGREVLYSQLRVPAFALERFEGSLCDNVWPYGKHLFMQFGERILHTHLKMEGTWSVHPAWQRWKKPGHTARVVLRLEGAPHPRPIEVVGFSLGFVRVFPTAEYAEKVGYLGPDVLGDWDEAEAARRILARPDRPIGTALLDQKNLAGVGNEYRAEICFIAGIHPATPVAHLGPDRVHSILAITRRLMWENRNSPIRVSTGVRKVGETSYVFGRNNKPCRRCGTLIENGFLGGVDRGGDADELERVIWWCPTCQPLL